MLQDVHVLVSIAIINPLVLHSPTPTKNGCFSMVTTIIKI